MPYSNILLTFKIEHDLNLYFGSQEPTDTRVQKYLFYLLAQLKKKVAAKVRVPKI